MLFFIAMIQSGASVTPWIELLSNLLLELFVPLLLISLLQFVHRIYNSHFPKWLWITTIAISLVIVLDGLTDFINSAVVSSCIMWLVIFCVITMVRGAYKAIREKISGAKILGAGMGIFALFIFCIVSLAF